MPPDARLPALPVRDLMPWMRQDHETGKAYEAFAVYRDLGPTRAISGVERHFAEIGRRRNRRLYERWSAQWAWVRRSVLYDQDVDRRKWEEDERKRVEMVDRHGRAFQALFAKAMQRVVGSPDNGVQPIDMNDVGYRDLVSGVVELAKMERTTRGVPAEHTRQDITGMPSVNVEVNAQVTVGLEERRERSASMLAILAASGVIELGDATTEPGAETLDGEYDEDDDGPGLNGAGG